MGRNSAKFISWGLGVGLALSASAQQSKFFDTTDGNPKTDTKGGILPSDEATISAETQKLLDRFRSGRYSSNKDGKSRYSGILEMHDEDFDGVTDHDNPGNSLEGGMDEAAIGQKGGSGENRRKALAKQRENAGNCKDGFVNGNKKFPCKNISAVIVDRGAAHGPGGEKDAEEPHRILELSDKAYAKAKQAGQAYGDSAVNAAEDYVGPAPAGAQGIKDKNGLVTSMKVQSGDQTTTVKVGANVDLLKSEYAWLERQKQRQIDLEWQSLRAARLAGAEKDPTAIRLFADVFGNNNMSDQQRQQEAATRIFEWSQISDLDVCMKSGEFLKSDSNGKPNCSGENNDPIGTLSEFLSQKQDPDLAQKKWAEARKLVGQGDLKPKEKKEMAQEVAKIRNCLGRDVWCYDRKHAMAAMQKNNQNGNGGGNNANARGNNNNQKDLTWTPVQGDPGNAFDDVREALFNRLSAANAGGLDNFKKVMSTIDFNEKTDAKTNTKPFREMMEQLKKAQAAAKLVQSGQGDTEQVENNQGQMVSVRQNGIQVSSQNIYGNKQNFDTKTMNTLSLFGRNPARDGGALANVPMPVGPQPITSENSGGGNSGGARAPAPPPSNYGNGFNDRLNTGY